MTTNKDIEGDAPLESYDLIKRYAKTIKGVEGLTCEIGVRMGLGSKSIIEGCLENDDKRTHLCIDPYGNIVTDNPIYGVPRRHDHTNERKFKCMMALGTFAFENKYNVLFLPFEDSEFYNRFADGVPVYIEEKQVINKYALVHIDGAHNYNAVAVAAKFFIARMDVNSIIIFDNCDHYNHSSIEHDILYPAGYSIIEDFKGCHKRFYRKVK